MATKTKVRRSTLVDDPEMAKVKVALAARGFETLKDAAESVGFDLSRFVKILHQGLSSNPSARTVDRLKKLGIAELVKRR